MQSTLVGRFSEIDTRQLAASGLIGSGEGWYAWSADGFVRLGEPHGQPEGDSYGSSRLTTGDGRALEFWPLESPMLSSEPPAVNGSMWQLVRLDGPGIEQANKHAIIHRSRGGEVKVVIQSGQRVPSSTAANAVLSEIGGGAGSSDDPAYIKVLPLRNGDATFIGTARPESGSGFFQGLWRSTPSGELTLVYDGNGGGESAALWRGVPASAVVNWRLEGSGRSTRWVVAEMGKAIGIARLGEDGRLVGAFATESGDRSVMPLIPGEASIERVWAGSDDNLYLLARSVCPGQKRVVAGVTVREATRVELGVWVVNSTGRLHSLPLPADSAAKGDVTNKRNEWSLERSGGDLLVCTGSSFKNQELWLLGYDAIRVVLRSGVELDHGRISYFDWRCTNANGRFAVGCWIEPAPGSNMVRAHGALVGGKPGDVRLLLSNAAAEQGQGLVMFQAYGIDNKDRLLVTIMPNEHTTEGGVIQLP